MRRPLVCRFGTLFVGLQVLLAAIFCTPAAVAEPIAVGMSQRSVEVGGWHLNVFAYRPASYRDGPLIVACHGVLRNADEYRNFAKKIADRMGAIVIAPCFDDDRFPQDGYHFGGVFKEGELQPTEAWTVSLIPKIVESVRCQEGRDTLPYYLLGHSAGGQFLARLSGMTATQAERIVLANPGSYLFPTRDMPFPYGFGGLPDDLSDDLVLQRYLAQPITIYLGGADTEGELLPTNELANQQGLNRNERGHNCFRMASELAAARGWTLNWRLVEAPEIGHDAEAMFRHVKIAEAIYAGEDLDTALPEILVDEGEMMDEDELNG